MAWYSKRLPGAQVVCQRRYDSSRAGRSAQASTCRGAWGNPPACKSTCDTVMPSLPLAPKPSSTSLTGASTSKAPSAASSRAVRATAGFTAEYMWKRLSGVQRPKASDTTISPS